jgi:hypothetical protein
MTTYNDERKYKQGFVREDGKVFHGYKRRMDGSLSETWMTPEAFTNYRCKTREWIGKNYDRHRENVRRSMDKRKAKLFPDSEEITRKIIEINTPLKYQFTN